MAGILGNVVAGAAQGFGEGVASTSAKRIKEKRALALEGLRSKNNLTRDAANNQARSEIAHENIASREAEGILNRASNEKQIGLRGDQQRKTQTSGAALSLNAQNQLTNKKHINAMEMFREKNKADLAMLDKKLKGTAKNSKDLADIRAAHKLAQTARDNIAAYERGELAADSAVLRSIINAGAKLSAAKARATGGKDRTAAQDRIIARHTETDTYGSEAIDHAAAAISLEKEGWKTAAAQQRRLAEGKSVGDDKAAAEEQADAEVDDKAGLLRSDNEDFKKDGGSRTRYRARRVREIMAERKGDRTGKPAAKADDVQKLTGTSDEIRAGMAAAKVGSRVQVGRRTFIKREKGFEEVK